MKAVWGKIKWAWSKVTFRRAFITYAILMLIASIVSAVSTNHFMPEYPQYFFWIVFLLNFVPNGETRDLRYRLKIARELNSDLMQIVLQFTLNEVAKKDPVIDEAMKEKANANHPLC